MSQYLFTVYHEHQSWGRIYIYKGLYLFFFHRSTSRTTHPMLTHDGSNDAACSKEVPFGGSEWWKFIFWGSAAPKTANILASEGKSQLKLDCSVTFKNTKYTNIVVIYVTPPFIYQIFGNQILTIYRTTHWLMKLLFYTLDNVVYIRYLQLPLTLILQLQTSCYIMYSCSWLDYVICE